LSGEVTGVHAYIALRRWQWAESRELFEQALRQAPDSEQIHGFYAQLLASRGDVDGALAHAARAWDLNAFSPIANAQLAVSLMWKGAIGKAERQFQIGDELGLQDLGSPGRLLLLRMQNKEVATSMAMTQLHDGFGLPSNWVEPVVKGVFDLAHRPQAIEAFDTAIRAGSVLPRLQWPLWVLLENNDRAFSTFRRFAEAGQYLNLDVELLSSSASRGFRSDARYPALATRYGLPLRPVN
jgi:tetratricopeptide (TPR) repeat protein